MADDRLLLPASEIARSEVADTSGGTHEVERFRDTPLASVLVRVALAIEERERASASRSSGGANEGDDFETARDTREENADDVPMTAIRRNVA